MTKRSKPVPRIALLGSLLLAASVTAAAAPKIRTGAGAEVTFDGLYRVDDAVMDKAWIKPDLDLGKYRKILLLPVGMTFKEVRDPGLRSNASEFPLSEQQKSLLKETILAAFTEELGKLERFEVTDQPGRDVLLVRGAILDVVSHVPPGPVGRGGFILKSVGEATLVVELRDSLSDEILARAVDHRAASSAFARKSSTVNNLAEVRSAAHAWARLLRRRLDELSRA